MKIGVIIQLDDDRIDEKIEQAHELGFRVFQLCGWNHDFFTDETAEKVLTACRGRHMEISTFWCGWSGEAAWNFYEGQTTLGIVPLAYRARRVEELKHGSDFAKKLGVSQMATHMGYMPENPLGEDYLPLIAAIREVAEHCRTNGQKLLFETGQETPVTLRRVIEDVDTGNLGINLDPANLILYGKANPIDALDVFGEFVCDVHAKDGRYPTNGRYLGQETVVGEGKVNFPAFVKRLREVGYDGSLIIEREISGEQQIKDIQATKIYLEGLIS